MSKYEEIQHLIPTIYKLKDEGHSIRQVCEIIGVKLSTLYEVCRSHPDVREAVYHEREQKDYIAPKLSPLEEEFYMDNYIALAGAVVRETLEEYVQLLKRLHKLESFNMNETTEKRIIKGKIKHIEKWLHSPQCDTLTMGLIDPDYLIEEARRKVR